MGPLRFVPKKSDLFGLNYSSGYQTFITHFVLEDYYHPLYTLRKRILAQREKKGLWWHVTVGPNTSKARVVRSWVRRRLRNAFLESLKERGVAEDGKIIQAPGRRSIQQMIDKGQEVSLTGSIRLHGLETMVSAKYVNVKEETGALVDGLLKALEEDLGSKGGAKSQEPMKTVKKSSSKLQGPGKAVRSSAKPPAYKRAATLKETADSPSSNPRKPSTRTLSTKKLSTRKPPVG